MNTAEILAKLKASIDRSPKATHVSVPVEWVRILAAGSPDPASQNPAAGDDISADSDVPLHSLNLPLKQLATLNELGLNTVFDAITYHEEVRPLAKIPGIGAATQGKILGV